MQIWRAELKSSAGQQELQKQRMRQRSQRNQKVKNWLSKACAQQKLMIRLWQIGLMRAHKLLMSQTILQKMTYLT
eukprot:6615608-Karenia_brevis.AAC.1